jgi:protein phosphatase
MKSESAARLEVGALSETGYVRDENQDRMSWSEVPLGHLYIVADGMGGHKGGALAAETAVQELQRHISQAPASESLDAVVQAAFKKANEAVHKKAHSGDPETEGMGTTAVLLLVSGQVAKLAHVGDSRAYLYRSDALSQLTTDHTVVQRMVDAGMLKPEEAPGHPDASVLERAIGSAPTIDVDIYSHQLRDGDVILLCSDGLCGYVADNQIKAVLRNQGTVQETAEKLVGLALAGGGQDNVTVQLIRYGARKEVRADARAEPVNPVAKPVAVTQSFSGPLRRMSRRTLAAIVVFVIVLGSILAAYYLMTSRTAALDATKEITNRLQKELESTNAALEKATKRAEEMQRQAATAGQNAKLNFGKLQKELQEARAARDKAAKQVEELSSQLAAQKQAVKTATAQLRKDLQEANASKEKLLTEAKGLRQELDSKERELRQARKQLEGPTSADKASPAQQETTPIKVPTETPPTTGAR